MKTPIRIEFAGGMTGGHFFPALALAQEFQARFAPCHIRFWGSKRGIEYRLKDTFSLNLKTIPVRGFQRRFKLANLIIPLEMLISFLVIVSNFIFHRPDIVIGTGGFVSGPVLFTAAILRIPSAIHEQNSYPGATTRLLSKWVKRVYLTYESSRKFFKCQEKIQVFGNPVRKMNRVKSKEEAQREFNLNPDKKTLFVFGGSQGGLGLNILMADIMQKLLSIGGMQILWATGPHHFENIKNNLGELENLFIHPFIENIYSAYQACDLAVCRAGATTLSELTWLGIPAILVPFPYATARHQELNARELEKANAAICLMEGETSGEQMMQVIIDTLNDKNKLNEMKKNMKRLARPNAATDIVSDICNHLLSD